MVTLVRPYIGDGDDMLNELKEIIAIRHLNLEGEPTVDIKVVLGKPQLAPNPTNDGSMLCPYQILGIGDEKVRCAGEVEGFPSIATSDGNDRGGALYQTQPKVQW